MFSIEVKKSRASGERRITLCVYGIAHATISTTDFEKAHAHVSGTLHQHRLVGLSISEQRIAQLLGQLRFHWCY